MCCLGVEDVMVGSDGLAAIRIDNDSGSQSSRSRGEDQDPGACIDGARLQKTKGDGDCRAGAPGRARGGDGGVGCRMDLFNGSSDGELAFGNRQKKSLVAVGVKEVADLIGGEMAVAVKDEERGKVGRREMVEIDHGVEGDERDEGVVGQVVEEVEELVLEGRKFVLGSGEIEEKDEGRGRGRGRGGGRRVLDGAVGGEEFGGEVGVGDGAGEGVA